jgi:uncharacterized membrane protein AbrB (regulator of aidB expression)
MEIVFVIAVILFVITVVTGYVLDKSRTLDHTTFLFDYA